MKHVYLSSVSHNSVSSLFLPEYSTLRSINPLTIYIGFYHTEYLSWKDGCNLKRLELETSCTVTGEAKTRRAIVITGNSPEAASSCYEIVKKQCYDLIMEYHQRRAAIVTSRLR
jgi:hypothetical protein